MQPFVAFSRSFVYLYHVRALVCVCAGYYVRRERKDERHKGRREERDLFVLEEESQEEKEVTRRRKVKIKSANGLGTGSGGVRCAV